MQQDNVGFSTFEIHKDNSIERDVQLFSVFGISTSDRSRVNVKSHSWYLSSILISDIELCSQTMRYQTLFPFTCTLVVIAEVYRSSSNDSRNQGHRSLPPAQSTRAKLENYF